MKIGFIGLGIMGLPMAGHLLKGGHQLFGYARSSATAEAAQAAGVVMLSSPQALAEAQVEVLFTMVSDTPDVAQVLFGPQGFVAAATAGTVVDMTTASAAAAQQWAQQLEQRGIGWLDAPVSGGQAGAQAGTLSFMVGGREATFNQLKPLLELMGSNIVRVGEAGAGQVAKACNQLVIAQTIAAVAEAISLATAAGVDAAQMRQALLGGFAASKVLEIHGQRMLSQQFTPGFKARLHQKDLGIVLDTARALNLSLPGAALAAQHLNALVGLGGGEEDSSALIRVIQPRER